MKKIILLAFLIFSVSGLFAESFLEEQKKYKRVREAIAEKNNIVLQNLKNNGLTINDLNILIVAYKAEMILDIYAKKNTDKVYKKIASYNVCRTSGGLGPKRKEGDYQIPEGFYHINVFNPYSSYYLSLGINYPNESDSRKSIAKRLGGDIFIHGSCVTIGCLPMTDDKIKEIYLYAVYAKNSSKSKIPVYIFPFKMTDANFENYKSKTPYKNDKTLLDFWKNIKTGYDSFLANKTELNISVDKNGNYRF